MKIALVREKYQFFHSATQLSLTACEYWQVRRSCRRNSALLVGITIRASFDSWVIVQLTLMGVSWFFSHESFWTFQQAAFTASVIIHARQESLTLSCTNLKVSTSRLRSFWDQQYRTPFSYAEGKEAKSWFVSVMVHMKNWSAAGCRPRRGQHARMHSIQIVLGLEWQFVSSGSAEMPFLTTGWGAPTRYSGYYLARCC